MPGLAPPVRRSAAPSSKARGPTPAKERPKSRVQAKLNVSEPADPLEHAADRAADRVMRAAATPAFPAAGHDTGTKEKKAQRSHDPKKRVDRKTEKATSTLDDRVAQREAAPGAGDGSGVAPAGFESSLSQARQAGGSGLSPDSLPFFESGFGQSFDHVRVHNDGAAASLSRSINARAFTIGPDIFFNTGEYQPHSNDGRRLIAHELAHVVQQGSGEAARAIQRNGTEDTTDQVTTGATQPSGQIAQPAPPAEPSFGGTRGRIIKAPGGGAGKQGTFFLPALKVPTVQGGPKGAADHPVTQLRGVAASEGGALRMEAMPSFVYTGRTPRGSESARRRWIAAAQRDTTLQDNLRTAVPTEFGAGQAAAATEATGSPQTDQPAAVVQGGEPLYYLKPRDDDGPTVLVVGTTEEVASHELVVLPIWDKQRRRHEFDVDHLHELQLGGVDAWENFWVMDASANRSSGSRIHNALERDVMALVQEAERGHFWTADGGPGGPKPEFADVVSSWRISFDHIEHLPISASQYSFWTRDEVKDADHLSGLRKLTEGEIAAAGLRFRPGAMPAFLAIYSASNGGYYKRVRHGSGDLWEPVGRSRDFYRGYDNVTITIPPFASLEDGVRAGQMVGRAFHKASKDGKIFDAPNIPVPLLQSRRLGFGLYADKSELNRELHALRMKQASPVTIDDSGISAVGTMFVEGHIQASLPLLDQVEIPFSIYGDELRVSFPIPTDRLRLGPVEVTEASLEMGVDPEGLTLGGAVAFLVRGVGRGRLVAGVGAAPPVPAGATATETAGEGGGFSLIGTFEFDTDKFDPASITVAYHHHQFTVDAVVGLRQGSVRGVESAQVHVHSGPDGLLVEGTAVLGIPGLAGTTLTVRRLENGDIEIGADDIPLPITRIPGVRSATASIHVLRNAESGEWRLSGGGSAEIGIAGVGGTLVVAIDGPFITLAAENITIRRGPLEGAGNFMVTNRPRDEQGQPIEGEPGEMTASGHLEASLPLGPYLRGTLGGTILPNGELEFTGGVALPPTVDLFEERVFDRPIFSPPSLDIPIFGITAAGQRIGIFATIGGSLTFNAGVGPGQLRDTALTATFNPDHPENTTVHGTATFVVPAHAGLRLAIHGGIGAGIPIVSAEAGIEVGGELGIVAEASAGVTVDWTPQQGLVVEALAHLHAQPQFTFDISAYVRVTADVLITEFELYSERWTLASYTFGPSLALGVDLPVRWTEQGGLDFDINRIEVQRPDIDFRSLAGDLVHDLVT